MEQRPDQPPEGKLIAAAASRMNLSIREAARRAGISYGRWRQITSGYQNVSPGNFAAVRAPARTLARMALAAGVTAEQMEAEGLRPDAAEAMRELQREHAGPPAPEGGQEDVLAEVFSLLVDPLERRLAESDLTPEEKIRAIRALRELNEKHSSGDSGTGRQRR